MLKFILLGLVIVIFIGRSVFQKMNGRSNKFLFMSFFIFTIPFEFSKAIVPGDPSVFGGALLPVFYITVPILLSFLLFFYVKLSHVSFRVQTEGWMFVVFFFILLSLINPYNESIIGTLVYFGFFFSHFLLFRLFDVFMTRKEIMKGLYDGLIVLCFVQCFMAILYPVLGVVAATNIVFDAEEAATRHGSRVGAIGTFKHPGSLAFFTVIATTFLMSCYLFNYRKKLSLLMIGLNVFTLICTFSRTSYLVLTCVIFIMVYLYRNPQIKIYSAKVFFKFLLPLSVFIIWLVFFSPLSDNFLESDSSDQYDNRMVHWLMALTIFQNSPFVGVGLNAHLAYVSHHVAIANLFTLDDFFVENPIHNIHLIILAETGIFGFICWVMFLFRNIYRAKSDLSESRNPLFSLAFIGIVTAYIIYGVMGWTPFSRALLPYFIFFCYYSIKFRTSALTN
jgi:O-antigen ligase